MAVKPHEIENTMILITKNNKAYENKDSLLVCINPQGEATGVIYNATGIDTLSQKQSMDFYDLSGRKVGTDYRQLSNRVYIINNKKVVVK